MTIREEREDDSRAVLELNRTVFRGDYEAGLIEGLRAEQQVVVSLVAVEADEVVGHVLFSPLWVKVEERDMNAVALAPLVVCATRQRQGIGSRLVTEGLAQVKSKGVEAVFVLGHVEYYPRFGFSPTLAQKLTSPFQGKPQFMALELVPGCLSGEGGSVKYPEAFGI